MDIDPEKAWTSPLLAGALGALVALRGTPGDSWPTRLLNIVAGALIAAYFSPAISEFFSLTSPAMKGALAFAAGMFGMNFVAMVVGWTKSLQLSDVVPWIRGRKE